MNRHTSNLLYSIFKNQYLLNIFRFIPFQGDICIFMLKVKGEAHKQKHSNNRDIESRIAV